LRSGQFYGSGEYFAKHPDVSMNYCKGGRYMLVCSLCLGVPSSNRRNDDGDHIWVSSCQYYVISDPTAILIKYIVEFKPRTASVCTPLSCEKLERALTADRWCTKLEETSRPLPRNRKCHMSRTAATVLWIGLFQNRFSDCQIESDIRTFLHQHVPEIEVKKVQLSRFKFTFAYVFLGNSIAKATVHKLNQCPFMEMDVERLVCVDDAHGSPTQLCEYGKNTGYCRGQNLRFSMPCWCRHPPRLTETARFTREQLDRDSAKYNELVGRFMESAPFHNGRPRVVGVYAINNPDLARLHHSYHGFCVEKCRGVEPMRLELFHGTNNNILDLIYQHGLQPPSDCRASDLCPVSGNKGLSTTLCDNSCAYCTERHVWCKCHMFGLGIYLADRAQKSHRYVSQPHGGRHRMVVCSVVGRACRINGHLTSGDAMHDVTSTRWVTKEELLTMVKENPMAESGAELNAFHSHDVGDLFLVQGLGAAHRPGLSVANSEYIAFQAYQCLPRYEIAYELD